MEHLRIRLKQFRNFLICLYFIKFIPKRHNRPNSTFHIQQHIVAFLNRHRHAISQILRIWQLGFILMIFNIILKIFKVLSDNQEALFFINYYFLLRRNKMIEIATFKIEILYIFRKCYIYVSSHFTQNLRPTLYIIFVTAIN